MSTHETLLRQVLLDEATAVETSPEAFDAIRDRVAARRSRQFRWRTSLAGGLALALVAGFFLTNTNPDGEQSLNTPPASQPPTTSPSPSPRGVVTDPDAPLGTAWPLTTRRQVEAWRTDPGERVWFKDPQEVAERFVMEYLDVQGASTERLGECSGASPDPCNTELDFAVSRTVEGTDLQVTVAHLSLRKYGPDTINPITANTDGPWLVAGVQAPRVTKDGGARLTVETPSMGAKVSSPVQVTGRVIDPDQNVALELRVVADDLRFVALDKAFAPAGREAPWQGSLDFSGRPSRSAAVLATVRHAADGGLLAAALVPVELGDAAAPTPVAAPPPSTFVGIKDGRPAVLSTATGDVLRYLSPEQPGGGAYNVSRTHDGRAVWAQGGGTCVSGLRTAPLEGGPVETLVPSNEGYLSHPVISETGLAYGYQECDGASSASSINVSGRRDALLVHPLPRGSAVTSLAWSPDGSSLVYSFRVGDRAVTGVLQVVAADGSFARPGTSDTPGYQVKAPAGCTYEAATWHPNGSLVVAQRCPGDQLTIELVDAMSGQGERRLSTLDTTHGVGFAGALDVDGRGMHVVLEAIFLGEGGSQVQRIELASGQVVRVVDSVSSPSWQ